MGTRRGGGGREALFRDEGFMIKNDDIYNTKT